MRRLILLRHAKSDWDGSIRADRDRPLSARGRTAAPVMGAYMAEHGLRPDHVLCSPALRTRQTWDLAAPKIGASAEIRFEDALYEADTADIMTVIRGAPAGSETLLVIGHNPGLEDTAALLVSAVDQPSRGAFREKFPTAALAVIDFRIDEWMRLKPRSGRLERFVTPKSLAAEAE